MTKPRKGRLPLLAVRVTKEWRGNVSAFVVGAVNVAKKILQVLFLLLLPLFLLLLLKLKLLLLPLFLLLLLLYGSYHRQLAAVVSIPFISFCSIAAHFVESFLTNDLLSSLLREGLSVEVVQLKALIRIGKVQALKKKFKIIHCLFFLELLRIFLRKYFSLKMCFTWCPRGSSDSHVDLGAPLLLPSTMEKRAAMRRDEKAIWWCIIFLSVVKGAVESRLESGEMRDTFFLASDRRRSFDARNASTRATGSHAHVLEAKGGGRPRNRNVLCPSVLFLRRVPNASCWRRFWCWRKEYWVEERIECFVLGRI